MKRAVVLLALLAPGGAHALLGTDFPVVLRDAATGQPLDGAFVVAREFATVGKFHGTRTYCTRADATVASGRTEMRLPNPGTDVFTTARAIEALAYHPGYCVARTQDGRVASYGGGRGMQMGTSAAKPVDPSTETVLDLRASTQGADERLLYLTELTAGLFCNEPRWNDRGRDAVGRMADSMLREATGLANTRYQKVLAARMRDRLAIARTLPAMNEPEALITAMPAVTAGRPDTFTRDFIVAPANYRVSWSASPGRVIAGMPAPRPQAMAIAASPAGVVAKTPAPAVPEKETEPALVIHCRHGNSSACDLDERDAEGATALAGYVANLKPAEVKVLLDAGADPSIPSRPFGAHPIDALLRRMSNMAPTSSDAQPAREILALLAAHPKVTLTQVLRDDLAADPSTWGMVRQLPSFPLYAESRERLRALPVRQDGRPSCPPLGLEGIPGLDYGTLPFRLRVPS